MKYLTIFCIIGSVFIVGLFIGILSVRSPDKSNYQLYPYQNTMVLMDGKRVVGVLPYDSNLISETVLFDNQ